MQVDVAGPPPPGGSANTLHGRSPNQVYRWTGTVLANAEHGPQMCIGGVLTSMPPQCGGIPLAGFDWSQVPQDAQSAAGQVRWADRLTLTGTYDGRTFTITKPPAISNGGSESMPPANGQSDLPAPCPPPPGGWRVTDPSKVSITDYQGFTSYANSQPDLSAIWQDNTTPVAGYTGKPLVQRQPVGTVMVVAFTGDLAKHRADIAALWGGPVCVIERTPSKTQMAAFQERLQRPDVKAAGVDVVSSGQTLGDGGPTVAVTVLIEDAVTKAWFAANARDIPVTITGVLQPVS